MEREHQALGSARLARAIDQGATSTLERNAGIRSKPALCLSCEECVCAKTPVLSPDDGLISVFDAEVVHDAGYCRSGPSADDGTG